MAGEHPLCCTTSVAVGQKAFNNYNGIGISLAYSPQPPSAAQMARGPSVPSHLLQPPPMLAVVLDASMNECSTRAATQALTQALGQLNPQTRILLLVVDQVVSIVDLKTPRPQSWVLHTLSGQGPAALPQLVQAADIRATPLAHCQPYLASSLAAVRHYPRHQSLQHHLRIMAAAADIALFLLTASMAAWDAQHKQQPQQQQGSSQPSQHQEPQVQHPLHSARVMVLTGLPNNSSPSSAHAADQLRQLEDQVAQQFRTMYHALAWKAASLDIPIGACFGQHHSSTENLFLCASACNIVLLLPVPTSCQTHLHLHGPSALKDAACAESTPTCLPWPHQAQSRPWPGQIQHIPSCKAVTLTEQALTGSLHHMYACDPATDVITGSTSAPAALLFQEAVDVSCGRLLHQPQLQPSLAANIAAIAQSRFGWEGVLDIKLPAGIKLLSLSGPIARSQPLPQAAYASGTTQLPVTLLTSPKAAATAAGAAAAAASKPAAASPDAAAAGGQPGGATSPPPGQIPAGSAAAVVNLAGSSGGAGPMQWGPHAVSVPVLSSSTRFVAALELSRDWPAGSSFEVEVVCEWTAVDGRRVRQVCGSRRTGPGSINR